MKATMIRRQPCTTGRPPLAVLACFLLLIAACGGSTAAPEEAAAGPSIGTQATDIGEVLADPDGLTLYAFTDDVDGETTCFDSCATAWPPAAGNLSVPASLQTLGFDSIDRGDGSTQLRVANRWPVYTFAGDAAAGDITGQTSAGVWFAVASNGTLIGLQGAADEAAAPDDDGEEQDQTVEEPEAGDDSPGVAARVAIDTVLGKVLSNEDGRTLYVFANDSTGTSNCNDPCSSTWPPVATNSDLTPELPADRFESLLRTDGVQQVTLDGMPLYLFKDDAGPGDVNGQNVSDVWFAVSDQGKVIVPPALRMGSTDAGDALIDDESFTLYQFANDSHGVSNCDSACLSTWPIVPGGTRVGSTLDPAQFGEITRDDGTKQLTFEKHPLYRYTGDKNPGDTNGVLVGAPGTWSVIEPDRVRQIEDDGVFGNVIGSPTPPPASAAEEDTAEAAPPAAEPTVFVGDTEIGEVVVDAAGRTLYAFLDDPPDASVCNDACAVAWPPIPGSAIVDASVVTGATSVITRDDGSTQLAIGIWPAYLFAGDAGPGDVNGQGSGDVWFAIAPDGSLIK